MFFSVFADVYLLKKTENQRYPLCILMEFIFIRQFCPNIRSSCVCLETLPTEDVMQLNRALIVVMDSMGCGAMDDAHLYGDAGCDTIGHISQEVGGLKVPNLQSMGLGNIHQIKGVEPAVNPKAFYSRLREKSNGKDTTTGHWEIAGIITEKAFPTYPNGFPTEIMEPFEKQTGKQTIGNYPASGTKIIDDLGEEHVKTGKLIVYTSADSVFQIAAHEEVVPIDELYRYCEIAREILVGEHPVSRVIARPFLGTPGNFYRTEHRKDFALSPPGDTMLDLISRAGMQSTGIGKIEDIFCHMGLTNSYHTTNNHDGMECIERVLKEDTRKGLIFANLVDFDMLYGHRRDPRGYADAIEAFDAFLPRITAAMQQGDSLIITADHGCDPTFKGSDHTREHVPLLWYMKGTAGGHLGTRNSFADISATILDMFAIPSNLAGDSFSEKIKITL